ncbi:hypothetical protein SDC9_171576 [bioreactor metagenome]|uniref:Uncharacterized protein n=1 Tax=bioreactor metagenome TaxID=1076179 RepID=A0A645GDU7_9ZZZZ
MGSSTGAFFAAQDTDVTGAVAEQRECFFGNACEYQLAFLAIRQYLTGIRVDDFSDKVVFIDVHTCLFAAFKGHARPRDFGEPVNIIGFDAKLILNILAHFLTPGFRTEDTGFQLNFILKTHFTNRFP